MKTISLYSIDHDLLNELVAKYGNDSLAKKFFSFRALFENDSDNVNFYGSFDAEDDFAEELYSKLDVNEDIKCMTKTLVENMYVMTNASIRKLYSIVDEYVDDSKNMHLKSTFQYLDNIESMKEFSSHENLLNVQLFNSEFMNSKDECFIATDDEHISSHSDHIFFLVIS